jgi:hypothetical protein
MIHREFELQKAVKIFVKRCVSVPHEFASHDSAAKRSDFARIEDAGRGVRRGWPDTELLLDGGRTFRCELKRPGRVLDEDAQQTELLTRLVSIGHPSSWANSVTMYGTQCERFGVPLYGNWRTVAQLADEHVLAQIRKQELKKKPVNPDAQMVKPRPKPTSKRTPKQIAQFEAMRIRTLPR